MSSLTKVCFDASIHDTYIGIGIFNFDTKEKLSFRVSLIQDKKIASIDAERIALVKAIHYLREQNITSAHLFTDNIELAEKGLSKTFKNEFSYLTLNWIPREFNKDADKMSKEGHTKECFLKIDKMSKKVEKMTKKTPDNTPYDKKHKMYYNDAYKKIINADLPKRVNILRNIARNKYEHNIIESIENGTEVTTVYSKNSKTFLKLVNTIINKDERESTNHKITEQYKKHQLVSFLTDRITA